MKEQNTVEQKGSTNWFAKFFKFEERKTNFRQEIIGGIVTFLAMSYILVVNPLIVSGAIIPGADGLGVPYGAVFLATAISAIVATLLMAFSANLPIALAPGMGVNAFFVSFIIVQKGYSWEEALALSLIAGVVFLLLSFTKIRKMLISSIPNSLKAAIAVGIGFFIASVGLTNSGLISVSDAGLALGDLSDPGALLSLISLVTIILIYVLKGKINRFAFIISIVVSTLFGLLFNYGFGFTGQNIPAIGNFDYSLFKDFGDVAFVGLINGFKTLFTNNILEVFFLIFALLFVDIFDTAGTLIAVGNAAGLTDEEGNIPNIEKAFMADAVGTIVGVTLGTPVVTSFVESATGVEAGARTGFSSIIVAILFALSIVLFPVFNIFSSSSVTAGALVLVGVLMAMQLKNIDWSNPTDAITSFLTIIFMLLTGSIANGIAFGFIFYTLIKLVRGEIKEVHPILYGTSIIFLFYFGVMAVIS